MSLCMYVPYWVMAHTHKTTVQDSWTRREGPTPPGLPVLALRAAARFRDGAPSLTRSRSLRSLAILRALGAIKESLYLRSFMVKYTVM